MSHLIVEAWEAQSLPSEKTTADIPMGVLVGETAPDHIPLSAVQKANLAIGKEAKPLPVTVLSGFLGAGKTTMLTHLLQNRAGVRIALVVNDMAAVNVDAELVREGGVLKQEEKMVELSNGCICCTLREDLLSSLAALAEEQRFDHVLVESSGVSEPLPVAETFTFYDHNSGASLSDVASLHNLVTVVDAASLLEQLASVESLVDRGWEAGEGDTRSVAGLLVDQLEFADVLVVNKADLLRAEQLRTVEALLQRLNPKAEILQTEFGRVDPELLLGKARFSLRHAEAHPQWLAEAREHEHTPETVEFGISSFVFRAKRPFHPQRLHNALGCRPLQGPLKQLLRVKGAAWLAAEAPASVMLGQLALAGTQFSVTPVGLWWAAAPRDDWPEGLEGNILAVFHEQDGGRQTELVCIGQQLDHAAATEALQQCLLSEQEMAAGAAAWASGGFKKKPKLSKAERRELQEKQRGAKAAAKGEAPPAPAKKADGGGGGGGAKAKGGGEGEKGGKEGKGGAGVRLQYDDPKAMAKAKRNQAVQNKVPWFVHLPQYEREASLSSQLSQRTENDIHPEVLKLGLKLADWLIVGGNNRTVAMLQAFSKVVMDYAPPKDHETGADMSRHLDTRLKPMISYLVACRPLSIGMGNAIRWLKGKIAHLPPNQSIQEAKDYISDQIEAYINEKVVFASRIISKHGASKINAGDVILVYARSASVEATLLRAHREGTKFRVMVVDSRPKLEGKKLLDKLSAAGVSCTYIMINALSYVMKEVSKVFLGASAVLSNGHVISRVGTAAVAMMAKQSKIPVLICCEMYKFSEKVMLDSICTNELGDPDELLSPALADWRDVKDMKLLNLCYDLTPAESITLVITELGHLPPTSVPVVIREYRNEVTL